MPYKNLNDLPQNIRDALPEHAQEIFKESFNSAWEQYKNPENLRDTKSREETAFSIGWMAVKKMYEKDEKSAKWKKK